MHDIGFVLPQLVTAYLAYLVATISPGPANVAIMTTAMRHGRLAGLQLAAGVILGSLTWGVLAALGLSVLLARYGGLLEVIRIAGGLYLLWLAVKSARAAFSGAPPQATTARSRSAAGYVLVGLAIHLTNPKSIFAWLAIIAIAMTDDAPAVTAFAVVAGCWLMGICVFGGYALAFSTERMIRAYGRFRRWIEGAAALVFCAGGLRLLIGQR
ncbi:MAG: LysE family transporter [Pseudomonadota bacterium]